MWQLHVKDSDASHGSANEDIILQQNKYINSVTKRWDRDTEKGTENRNVYIITSLYIWKIILSKSFQTDGSV